MKPMYHPCLLRFVLVLAVSLFRPASSFGQGSLTPPGPPAPTFKTLEQIEPRTPITNLPILIFQSGAYYLTTNLTAGAGGGGITITGDNITLDLGGFALIGVPG